MFEAERSEYPPLEYYLFKFPGKLQRPQHRPRPGGEHSEPSSLISDKETDRSPSSAFFSTFFFSSSVFIH